MSNRRPSFSSQLITVMMLGLAWVLTRAFRRGTVKRRGQYPGIRYGPAGVTTLILFAADLYAVPHVLRSKAPIGTAELEAANAAQIPLADLLSMAPDPGKRWYWKCFGDRVLIAIVLLPLLLLADRQIRGDAGRLGMLYAWMHAVAYTLYSYSPLGPAFIDKYRPVVYFSDVPIEERARGNNRNASYSGHTGNAACASAFMAKVFCDYHPELPGGERTRIYLAALTPPLLLGWLRIAALKHFPSDVLQAILIGGSCGLVIPELHRR